MDRCFGTDKVVECWRVSFVTCQVTPPKAADKWCTSAWRTPFVFRGNAVGHTTRPHHPLAACAPASRASFPISLVTAPLDVSAEWAAHMRAIAPPFWPASLWRTTQEWGHVTANPTVSGTRRAPPASSGWVGLVHLRAHVAHPTQFVTRYLALTVNTVLRWVISPPQERSVRITCSFRVEVKSPIVKRSLHLHIYYMYPSESKPFNLHTIYLNLMWNRSNPFALARMASSPIIQTRHASQKLRRGHFPMMATRGPLLRRPHPRQQCPLLARHPQLLTWQTRWWVKQNFKQIRQLQQWHSPQRLSLFYSFSSCPTLVFMHKRSHDE